MQVNVCADSCTVAASGRDLQRYLGTQSEPFAREVGSVQPKCGAWGGGTSAPSEIPIAGSNLGAGCWVSGQLRRSVPAAATLSLYLPYITPWPMRKQASEQRESRCNIL